MSTTLDRVLVELEPERLRPLPPLPPRGSSPAASLTQSVMSALEALAANKARAALTMLGIIIGVGAVIVVVAIGTGAAASVAAQLSRLGTNVVSVNPGSGRPGGVATGAGGANSLTNTDVQAIEQQVPHIQAISPMVDGQMQVVANGQNWNTRIQAAMPAYQTIGNYTTNSGTFVTQADETAAAPVAVLGQTVVQNLFPNRNPIGQTIRIRNVNFQVIGVLTSKGNNGFFNQDDLIIIPYSAGQLRLFGFAKLDQIQIQVDATQNINTVITDVTKVLDQTQHILPGHPADFTVRNQQQFVDTLQQSSQTLTALLTAVAAVSLVVGGIGIMNIMLVSVTERTREIGIRMAVGARARDVLLQFLVEAVTLALVGGTIGIIGGVLSTFVLTRLAGWPTIVSPSSMLLAFGCSAAIGIFFGFYPARSASLLDPIQALRHE